MPKFHTFVVKGIVQRVGFRPFVYREANKRNLKGYIKNTGQNMEIIADNKYAVLEIKYIHLLTSLNN